MKQIVLSLLMAISLALAVPVNVKVDGSLPDEVPDLGLPTDFQLDFGFLTDVQTWFDPDKLTELQQLIAIADVFRRVVELPENPSITDFLEAFTGLDPAYDDMVRSVQGLLEAGGDIERYLRLIDPDGLLRQLPSLDATARPLPLRLHSAPLAADTGGGRQAFPEARYDDLRRVSMVDTHPYQIAELLPYVELTGTDEASGVIKTVSPNLPISQSVRSAKELQKAWLDFEERYFQRVNAFVNQPIPYLLYCRGGGSSFNGYPVEPGVSVDPDDVHPSFLSATGGETRLPYGRYDDHLYFENGDYLSSWLFPKVPGSRFCDGLEFRGPHWVPGIRLKVCGVTVYESDDFPRPLYVNTDNLRSDVEDAIVHAHTTYLPEYLSNTLGALIPNKAHPLLFPTPWQVPVADRGRVLYPVADNDNVDLAPLDALGDLAGELFDGSATGELAKLYYFAPLLGMAEEPALKTAAKLRALIPLLEPSAMAQGANGVYLLEELKRWLPPSNAVFQEWFGFQNFYRVEYQPRVMMLPHIADLDELASDGGLLARQIEATAIRQPLLYYVGIETNVCIDGSSYIVPVPGAPLPVWTWDEQLAYLALGYPFVGLQARFDWITVPEGYPVPGVAGAPLIDYWGLPFLGGTTPGNGGGGGR